MRGASAGAGALAAVSPGGLRRPALRPCRAGARSMGGRGLAFGGALLQTCRRLDSSSAASLFSWAVGGPAPRSLASPAREGRRRNAARRLEGARAESHLLTALQGAAEASRRVRSDRKCSVRARAIEEVEYLGVASEEGVYRSLPHLSRRPEAAVRERRGLPMTRASAELLCVLDDAAGCCRWVKA